MDIENRCSACKARVPLENGQHRSVESTRRELFEAWDSQAFADFDHEKDQLGEYVDNIVHQCWMAFNAALDAVEIKLPSVYDFHSTSGMKRGCTEAIESLNLGLKIK